jgi:hypothetical protein
MTTNNQIALQDSRSKLFYDRELGGFSQSEIANATLLENDAQVAYIKAHFACPEFIESVKVDEPAVNKHLDGSVKAVKISHHKDGSRTYRFGDWTLNCYYYNQHVGAHPYVKATTPRLVPMWSAYNDVTEERLDYQDGAMKVAVRHIIRHEKKRAAAHEGRNPNQHLAAFFMVAAKSSKGGKA